MEFLNDNIGTFSSNVEVIQLLPQQISKKSINVKDKTGDSNNAQTQADNSNINPSHYLIKDSDMPTVLLNTGGAINNDKPNVKTYVQFVQPNGNIHQIVQGVVKSEQKIVKTPDIPLVLSPIHFATQTQAQNEKIKIVIPTITEQQNPVQNIHYKLPKSEVIINRFHENVNYPPNLEQFQLSQLADHPLLEEQQQFFPLQNMNAPGRMIHTIYPHKKSDENHSNEREGNDNFGKESQRYDMDREYSSNVNRYSNNSQERNLDLVSNEESAEHGPSQAGSKNSRTDSKIQFDYVDSKTRIQPHGVNIVGENVKVKESRQGKKQSDEEADNDESSTVSSHIYHEKTSGESYEQNTGSPVNDLVQKYVDNYNKQESKHNEQISEPDVVIQKSLQTEYRLYSQENENTQEENRFVPLNYVTPVPSNNENTNGNTNILNGHIQTFQLSDKNSGNINTNNENPFATKKPEQNSSPQQQQIPYILNGNAQSFQLPEIHNGKFVDSKKPQINFNTQAHHSPQIQHHHITQHIRGNHNNNVQENKGNTKVNKEYKIAQIIQNGPNFQHHQQLPKSQTFSNGPVNNIGNLLKTNDAPVLLHNRVNTNSASLIGNTFKYSNNAQTQADNSNINPSHYLIKDSDMPTVLLQTMPKLKLTIQI
ncbi:putative uncharacterized protein DDB_G0282133 [Diaphorina citri]|uniref:Uncharacterized protein n=1 Tax=Diaphorina citri TaxID=121845 RepID=A0A1S3DMK6_DIACI|nr:putative uncharacterized protein DDB_G0282133 [Diaphorina citri]